MKPACTNGYKWTMHLLKQIECLYGFQHWQSIGKLTHHDRQMKTNQTALDSQSQGRHSTLVSLLLVMWIYSTGKNTEKLLCWHTAGERQGSKVREGMTFRKWPWLRSNLGSCGKALKASMNGTHCTWLLQPCRRPTTLFYSVQRHLSCKRSVFTLQHLKGKFFLYIKPCNKNIYDHTIFYSIKMSNDAVWRAGAHCWRHPETEFLAASGNKQLFVLSYAVV